MKARRLFFFLAFLITLSIASAQISCVLRDGTCTAEEICVLSLNDTNNSHAANCTIFSYKVCCDYLNYSLIKVEPERCNATEGGVVSIFNEAGSHAEVYGLWNYDYHVCVSPPLSCSLKAACDSEEVCLISMNQNTNSHVGNCTDSYPNKLCCGIPEFSASIEILPTYPEVDRAEGENMTIIVRIYDSEGVDNTHFADVRIWSETQVLFSALLNRSENPPICYDEDSYTWRCNITNRTIDIACDEFNLTIYAENWLGRSASFQDTFWVDDLWVAADPKNKTIVSQSISLQTQLSFCSGSTDYTGVEINFTLRFPNDTLVLTLSTTPDGEGIALLSYDNPPSEEIYNLTISAERGNITGRRIFWIAIVSSDLSITPTFKTFNLGEEGYRAFEFTLENPSSEVQSYDLRLVPQGIIYGVFSENQDTRLTIENIAPGDRYVGYIDIYPAILDPGSEFNLEFQSKVATGDQGMISFWVRVQHLYQRAGFSYILVPEFNWIEIFLLLALALLYIQKQFKGGK